MLYAVVNIPLSPCFTSVPEVTRLLPRAFFYIKNSRFTNPRRPPTSRSGGKRIEKGKREKKRFRSGRISALASGRRSRSGARLGQLARVPSASRCFFFSTLSFPSGGMRSLLFPPSFQEINFTARLRAKIRHFWSILLTAFVSQSALAFEFSKIKNGGIEGRFHSELRPASSAACSVPP